MLSRLRHPLRAFAMGLSAFAIGWGTTSAEGLAAAVCGAIAGVVVGEILGRSKLRLVIVAGASLLGVLLAFGLASLALTSEAIPEMLGAPVAVRGAAIVRFGVLAFAIVASLRTLLVRRPSALALELGLIAASVAAAFAAHRDGVIARPLWLSDWAWQAGIDPSQVLLAVGGGAVVILAVLLLAERRDGLSVSSVVALLAIALLAVLMLNVTGLPTPVADNDLGLTNRPSDQEAHHTPQGMDGGRGQDQNDGGRQSQDGGMGQDGGQRPDAGDGGGQRPDQPDGGMDGGAGQGMDGGFPPPIPFDGGMIQPQISDGGGAGGRPQSEQLDQQDGPSNSPAPMAVVLFEEDYSPPSQAYYFRQTAWSQFNGPRLVQTTRTDVDLDTNNEFPPYPTPVRDPPPALGRTRVKAKVALLVEHTHPFGLETPLSFSPASNPNPQRFLRAYRFEALSQVIDYRQLLGKKAGDVRWTPEVLSYYTQPPEDPRYRELAERILTKLPQQYKDDPFAKALAIKAWLDHELTYSTRHRHAGVEDPTADFLFGDKTGYCVHFAHAAVFLWRSVGIPARIGTGYMSAEDNRRGGSALLIRGGDAHAWPELALQGLGWVVLDISAERNLDQLGSSTDEDLQRLLGEMAREDPPDPMQPPEKKDKPYEHWGRDISLGFLAVLLAGLLVMYGIKLWRFAAPAFVGAKRLPIVAYRAALDALGHAGLVREHGETREKFAERVKAVSPSFATLTAMHLSARFRRPDIPLEYRPELAKDTWRLGLREVRREVPRATKRWRRWLGFLHPASFLESR